MIKGLTIILTFLTLPTFGQFPEQHLDMLSKINCTLTDSWTSGVSQTESFNGVLNFPAISVDLYTYKTVDDKDGNIGVSIYMFDTSYTDTIKAHPWGQGHDNSSYKFFETPSYIIVVGYFKSGGRLYDIMVAVLLRELEMYFNDNEEKL